MQTGLTEEQLKKFAASTTQLLRCLRMGSLPFDPVIKTLDEFIAQATHVNPVDEPNPFQLSVSTQLALLRRANRNHDIVLSEEDYHRLEHTAPAWPKGRLSFRSLRIRIGWEKEGVAATAHFHLEQIKRIFKFQFQAKPSLEPVTDRIRLAFGNHVHKPIVEWILFDLDSLRQRSSVKDVRNENSLADELLAFVWIFADYMRSINFTTQPGLIAAGYDLDSNRDATWRETMSLHWLRGKAGESRLIIENTPLTHQNNTHAIPTLL